MQRDEQRGAATTHGGFWRRALWALVYPVRRERTKPTLPGTLLIALALGVGVAAYNSSSNILFITLALLLASLVCSGILAWINLSRVTWRCEEPAPWRAGQAGSITVVLTNGKRFWPTYALWAEISAVRARTEPRPPVKERKLRARLAELNRRDARGRLHQLRRMDPGASERLEWSFRPERRGRWTVRVELVGSAYPFGFLQKARSGECQREWLVWPAAIEYQRLNAGVWQQPLGGERVARPGSGGDLLALRKYAPGDSHRLIHWKASARAGQLLVRQFARESRERLRLWVNTDAARWPREEQFEAMLSLAATLAEDLFRAGRLASVAMDDRPARPVRRAGDVLEFLNELAVAERRERAGASSVGADERGHRGEGRLVFLPAGTRGVEAWIDGEKAAAA